MVGASKTMRCGGFHHQVLFSGSEEMERTLGIHKIFGTLEGNGL